MTEPTSLGERIAVHRRRRGLSQVALGRLIGRSESWVSQVERGTRKVDRMSVLGQVAEALGVPVADLAPDAPPAVAAAIPSEVEVLRLALVGHPALGPALGAGAAARPDGADDFGERCDAAWRLVHASRFREAGPALAGLLSDLESARRSDVGDRRVIAQFTATAYQAAAAILAAAGEADAAWVAGDRASMAAEDTGDPGLLAATQFRLALALLRAGRPQEAMHAAEGAASALENTLANAAPQVISVYGALCLTMAVTAARASDRQGARRHLDRATDAARRLGSDRNDFDTEFGPTNVALHEVAVAVELGDAGEALDLARGVDPTPLSTERQGRYLVDVARAHAQRRNVTDAVAALLQSEGITPEQTRSHARVKELVSDLLQSPHGRNHADLRSLAARIGLPA